MLSEDAMRAMLKKHLPARNGFNFEFQYPQNSNDGVCGVTVTLPDFIDGKTGYWLFLVEETAGATLYMKGEVFPNYVPSIASVENKEGNTILCWGGKNCFGTWKSTLRPSLERRA